MSTDLFLDWQLHFDGIEADKLLVQHCNECEKARFPPMPICDNCGSRDWDVFEPNGTGTIYSYVIMRRPPLPEGYSPIVAVIELERDIFVISSIIGIEPHEVDFDMKVKLEFVQTPDGRKIHAFRPVD